MFKAKDSLKTVAELSDSDLTQLGLKGDHAALNELFSRHHAVAYRISYRLLGNESDSLDAVQNAFVNAFSNLHRFRSESSFRTWILRIVSNASLDLGRKRSRLQAKFSSSDTHELLPLVPARAEQSTSLSSDLKKQYQNALELLSDAHRQTFILHVEAEMSYKEIADHLDLSIGTVMSRLFYARQRLKALLAEYAI